jgi:predicted TIM-barrel fold metal-dependent hydrolase
MSRAGIDEAWVSHLPGIFWRDPSAGNAWLVETTRRHPTLRPVFAVHPEITGWEGVVRTAADAGAPAVRCDPTHYGIAPSGPSMRALAVACGRAGVALMLAVRLEDGRQRHPNDHAAELPAAAVRALVRAAAAVRIIVTHADRAFIEEVHFGSTPDEARRIWWDISWIWGPPEDHLETLLGTVGPARFVFGTGQPLRIPENSLAKLDLIDLTPADRAVVEAGNAAAARGGGAAKE